MSAALAASLVVFSPGMLLSNVRARAVGHCERGRDDRIPVEFHQWNRKVMVGDRCCRVLESLVQWFGSRYTGSILPGLVLGEGLLV